VDKKVTTMHASFQQGFAIFLFLLLSCSKQNMSETTSAERSSKTYLALGDSYSIGESVSANQTFPAHTIQLLRAQGIKITDPETIATTGWTTRTLLDALPSADLKASYDVVSLLIGVNNQYQGRSLAEYESEFTILLSRAIQYAANRPSHVFVLSIPDYSVTPFASGSDRAKIAAEIDAFNAANKAISLQHNVQYVDITSISREPDPTLIASDGLHPSGIQYRRWAELLAPMMSSSFNNNH
jgi:lysophospholipase L1-like esterase